MAWSLVGQTTGNCPDGSTLNVNLPGSPQEGDVVIVVQSSDAQINPGIGTSGYTTVMGDTANADPGHHIAYKAMGSTPDSVVQLDNTSGGEYTAAVIQVWRGADLTTPVDVTPTTATSTANANPNPPSITTQTDGCLIIICGVLDDDNVAGSMSPPSGFTNFLDHDSIGTPPPDNSTSMIASMEQITAGTIDPGAFTGSNDAWAAATIALRPASGGTVDLTSIIFNSSVAEPMAKVNRKIVAAGVTGSKIGGLAKTNRKIAAELSPISVLEAIVRAARNLNIGVEGFSVVSPVISLGTFVSLNAVMDALSHLAVSGSVNRKIFITVEEGVVIASFIRANKKFAASIRPLSSVTPFARVVRNIHIASESYSVIDAVATTAGISPLKLSIDSQGLLQATFRVNRPLKTAIEMISELDGHLISAQTIEIRAAVVDGSVVDVFINANKKFAAIINPSSSIIPFAQVVRNIHIASLSYASIDAMAIAAGVTPIKLSIDNQWLLQATFRIDRSLKTVIDIISGLDVHLVGAQIIDIRAAVVDGSVLDVFIRLEKDLWAFKTFYSQAHRRYESLSRRKFKSSAIRKFIIGKAK